MVPTTICRPMFTAGLFIIAKKLKQLNCPPTDGKQIQYIHVIAYYWARKKNEVQSHIT